MKAPVAATITLHMDGPNDEPLEIDVDADLTCVCGHKQRKRCQIFKAVDVESVLCDACGATFDVAITTVISFAASVNQTSEGVLEPGDGPAWSNGCE